MGNPIESPLARPLGRGQGRGIDKAPTHIAGFDEIAGGGVPRGRPTLVCGAAGCGKTLFAMEFLVRGAAELGEPGVFISFEESEKDLAANVSSLGFDLPALQAEGKLAMDHIVVDRSSFSTAGDFDLEGLFVRLEHAVEQVGAKRIVLDTIETLFSGFQHETMLRAELNRLFRWLKERGLTAVITAERGEHTLTRNGLEDYVSDCVILLEHKVVQRVSSRRLRIVKYRGTEHGTDEYPFLVDAYGFSVLPVTGLSLDTPSPCERVSSGITDLDRMLDDLGFYRGSSILLSGGSGTGKSTMAAHFAHGACQRGERCLFFAFEESPYQIMRNMAGVGIDLLPYVEQGLLRFEINRPSLHGLEVHIAKAQRRIVDFDPQVVIIDPMSAFTHAGPLIDCRSAIVRLADFLKARGVTTMFTSLVHENDLVDSTEMQTSSLMDTWISLRNTEMAGERNRVLYVLKSRGMEHSNQIREFVITAQGIRLLEVYTGPDGVSVVGSARVAREAQLQQESMGRQQQIERQKRELERKRRKLEAQIEALRSEFQAEEDALQQAVIQAEERERELGRAQARIAQSKQANGDNRASAIERGMKREAQRD